jgi:hemerythrin-like domain-containing protein
MKATEILMGEHRVIGHVLAALEAAAGQVEAGQPVRPGFFIDAAAFIRGFADGCHHKKEEDVLFKTMERYGVPASGGPLGVMLSEHEMGRRLTRQMHDAAQRWQAGDESARSEVVQAARAYVALLRQHMFKENNVLFPMADQVIPPAQYDQVAEGFEHVEHEETGEGVHEKYLALATQLEQEVNPLGPRS